MRLLLLLCLLGSLAVAQPVASRGQGTLSASRPQVVGLEGASLRGEVTLARVLDLRDCQQWRMSLQLSNPTDKKRFWALHVVLLDNRGRLLGACSQASHLEGGRQVRVELDMGMDPAEAGRAHSFRIVFYEDSRPISER